MLPWQQMTVNIEPSLMSLTQDETEKRKQIGFGRDVTSFFEHCVWLRNETMRGSSKLPPK